MFFNISKQWSLPAKRKEVIDGLTHNTKSGES
jgi:hypothetical protein